MIIMNRKKLKTKNKKSQNKKKNQKIRELPFFLECIKKKNNNQQSKITIQIVVKIVLNYQKMMKNQKLNLFKLRNLRLKKKKKDNLVKLSQLKGLPAKLIQMKRLNAISNRKQKRKRLNLKAKC